jgi:hypothetical protein
VVEGLDRLAGELSQAAVDAYGEGDIEAGDQLTNQSDIVQRHKADRVRELERAGQLLLTEREVLGVALVLPEPLDVETETEAGTHHMPMKRDDSANAQLQLATIAITQRDFERPGAELDLCQEIN